jgi:hypothetical protein
VEEEDALRVEVFAAIASLASPGVVTVDRRSVLTKAPLNLTGTGLAVLAVQLSRLSDARGGGSVSLSEVKAARTAGGCIDLVRRKIAR